jgi:hypothetical protein
VKVRETDTRIGHIRAKEKGHPKVALSVLPYVAIRYERHITCGVTVILLLAVRVVVTTPVTLQVVALT